jgi:hypothetical protein
VIGVIVFFVCSTAVLIEHNTSGNDAVVKGIYSMFWHQLKLAQVMPAVDLSYAIQLRFLI